MKAKIKYIISLFFNSLPVKRRVIFESHPDYSGNTFQVYNKMIESGLNEQYEFVWYVENPEKFKDIKLKNVKFKKYYCNSKIERFNQVTHLSRSALIIFENKIIKKVNSKTKSIFLNHGTLLKNIKGVYEPEKALDYFITASNKIDNLYEDVYQLDNEKLMALGYPRNDVFFKQSKFDWREIFGEYSGEKVIIWMPTFRQHNSGERNDSNSLLPLGIPVIYDEQSLIAINELLIEKNIYLVLKAHFAQNLDFIKVNKLSNFKILSDEQIFNSNSTLYEVLKFTDGLITDYSSIYFDYLLLNKPIGLTNDDINDYKLGFVYDNIDEVLVGEKISNIDMLKIFIENIYLEKDGFKNERQKVNDIFNKYQDGDSADRILQVVRKCLDLK